MESTPTQPADTSPAPAGEVLRLTGITKGFPGVLALDGVDFTLRPGEVHVLFGENGAGKSTLINIIAGVFQPDAGTIELRGRTARLASPHHARQLGINAVFQEFSLVPTLSVRDNLYLGREVTQAGLIDNSAMSRGAREALASIGFDLDPGDRVQNLSRAQQQMVEIAKAMQGEPSILILDEPTASLTELESNRLFELIDRFKAAGLGIIYISHRIQEIRRIADRVTVLRDGKLVATLDAAGGSERKLVELMTGRSMESFYPTIANNPGEVVLRTSNLTIANRRIQDVSIEVRAGEVVGIAGLLGSGKSEVARACYGLEKIERGQVELRGTVVGRPRPSYMLDHGVIYVPPDRRAEGLVLMRPMRENITLAALDLPSYARFGLLRRYQERKSATQLGLRLNVRPLAIERAMAYFSGGNQQKVVFARGLTRQTELFMFDEPTIGVDVGAKAEIYQFIKELCERGAAVLLVSSDLPEILNLAHRAYVMHQGRLRAELAGAALTERAVLAQFFEADEEPMPAAS
jgi:ribose transport system ATP-binding protein